MLRAISKVFSWKLGDRGISSLEFSIVASVFIILLLGSMDLGRYFLTLHSLHTLTSYAARAALIDSTQHNCANVCGSPVGTSELDSIASVIGPVLDTSRITLNVSQATASGVTTITVSASYQFVPFAPVISSWAGTTLSDSTQLSY